MQFTVEQWETIAETIEIRAEILSQDCVDNNAGDREWNQVSDLTEIAAEIRYFIIGERQ